MTTPTIPSLFVRTLQMHMAGSTDVRDVVVRIGLPEPDPIPGGDFQVLVVMDGLDEPYSRHVHGIDELHAFLAACWLVSQILPALAPAGAQLTWLGREDLGFGDSPSSP